MAVGAIITFALDIRVGWLDLDIVGWILMVAGAVGLFMTLVIFGNRRRTTVVADQTVDRPMVREREIDRPL